MTAAWWSVANEVSLWGGRVEERRVGGTTTTTRPQGKSSCLCSFYDRRCRMYSWRVWVVWNNNNFSKIIIVNTVIITTFINVIKSFPACTLCSPIFYKFHHILSYWWQFPSAYLLKDTEVAPPLIIIIIIIFIKVKKFFSSSCKMCSWLPSE